MSHILTDADVQAMRSEHGWAKDTIRAIEAAILYAMSDKRIYDKIAANYWKDLAPQAPAQVEQEAGDQPYAWGSGDGYWVRAEDLPARPDKGRFTEPFYRHASPTPAAPAAPEPKCSPTLTECPRCKNDIQRCDGLFAAPAAPAGMAVPDDRQFIHDLLWGERGTCCGNPVVGAEYMGSQELICCGEPERDERSDTEIVLALRERFPFCAFCGGNDDHPVDHCTDCERAASPSAQAAPSEGEAK